MEEEKIKIITESLTKLITESKNFIDKSVSEGTIQPENELYFKWELEDFTYGENGVVSSRATGGYITKKSWIREIPKLSESIKKIREYKDALEKLISTFPKNQNIENNLNAFINKVIYGQLYPEEIRNIKKESLIERFINDLLDKPAKYGAEIQLKGIVIRTEKIEPAHGIIIRQTERDDLEKEVPFHGPVSMAAHHVPDPSAIANIEFLGKGAREIQIKVELMMMILKLFRVGSIKYLSYKMYSDSITDIMAGGTLTSGDREQVLETCIINKEDEEKLKSFWEAIERVLPQSLYDFGEKEINPISLAYDRYNDALMHNGLLERRIANVVMGLEALLLDATQELSYRLGLRVAKIISLLGNNPQESRQIIKDAYNIRNKFAHGSHLSYKEKKKLELRYKDIKTIFLSVINYLRQLIVIVLLIRRTKDEFIDLIDDSLIDKKREEELSNLLSLSKKILVL